ncbi:MULTISPECIES: hypothetical protein [unclassified Frankia]|uniref:hypothetical protein n=1 Tax=unclassified Frankia TaxID=2632575 RepID=UPI0020255592
MAAEIESLLVEDRFRVQRTMPADLLATPGYLAMNNHRFGIASEVAERASWRAPEAHRFNVEPGFVLLGVAPPERSDGGHRPMLLSAYDAQNGAGTQLLAAWWLDPGAPREPVAAFSNFLSQFGVYMTSGRNESLFFLRALGAVPPQPVRGSHDVELHALHQVQQFAGTVGWAWCFGINTHKYRGHLSVSGR